MMAALFCAFAARAQSVEYIPNAGQWKEDFRYKAVTGRGDVFLADNTFTYLIGDPGNKERLDYARHNVSKGPVRLSFHAWKVTFMGANPQPQIKESKQQQHYYNYFLGNDSTYWKGGVHPCLALDYEQLYPGIDMRLTSEYHNLKYEFSVAPGADPSQIRLQYAGMDKLFLKNNNLIIQTSVGEVTEMAPVAFQYINGERKEVPCRYRLKGKELYYDFPKGYDQKVLLIIDPTVVFSTFTGSVADNWGFTATYDDAGNLYAGGLVNSAGYPTTTGAFQLTFGGGVTVPGLSDSTHGNSYASDIGITKFNSTGTALIYSTYIGGADNETPHSMIVDGDGNLIMAGRTYSNNYPVTSSAFDPTKNPGADIVLTKLNAAGTALIGSTYIGGSVDDGVNHNALEQVGGNLKHNYGDDARSEVLVDKLGNIYLTASTKSADFPVTPGAFQTTIGGQQDAVFMKLDPTLSTMLYATFLGGSNDDAGYVMALDTAQDHVYVGGGTMSPNFPTTGSTLWPNYLGGFSDGWIARFQNFGSHLLERITFIGTNNLDQVYGLQTDQENNVYAMGQSVGGIFPVTPGVYSNPNSTQFVIKLDSNLTTNIYSTVFGSGDPTKTNISPVAFLVDTCQNVYISGWGGTLGFSTSYPPTVGFNNGMPISSDAIQSTTDGSDFYFIVLSKDAASLLYATYYGRFSNILGFGEHVDGGTSRFDKNGVIYQAICANCGGPGSPAFPTTPGSWATTVGSGNCNLAALKINFELSPPVALPSPDTAGCAPMTVHFQNNTINAVSYLWDFDDGTQSTEADPTHTFLTPGTYNVMLVAYNPVTCRVTDTSWITVVASTGGIQAGFTHQLLDSCGPFTAQFTNTSIPNTPAAVQYTWNFGDGTTFNGANPGIHSFPDTGTYVVTVHMTDSTACFPVDSFSAVLHFSNKLIDAQMLGPDTLCVGDTARFNGDAVNGLHYQWQFGDGSNSTTQNPLHVYTTAGVRTVTLVASNPTACNGADTVTKTLYVAPLPVADFSFTPITPEPNMPTVFQNLSTGAVSYVWDFGDGSGSNEEHPRHQYLRTGTYRTCLTATSRLGCKDRICKDVPAAVVPLADVPTAFSPNGDGNNDVLYVRGGAIVTMELRIYNRWGELVFETHRQDIGWDGTYKGEPQEMDAYAYILNATFIDGTSMQKQGNITLLR